MDSNLEDTSIRAEQLTYEMLREITDDFSEERKVGRGGFAEVYMGVTKNEKVVAVKIPHNREDHDYQQFQNEFDILKKVKHNNIAGLLAYCLEKEKTCIDNHGRRVIVEETRRALCFEYFPRSLDKYITDESCEVLDWDTRYKIIKGICEGLKYIHELDGSLVHCDLKPDNILLDENNVPKIADFGLSRFLGDDLTITTQGHQGTLGYMPPEYIDRKEVSKKFDIFSLGVIITKIVSGVKRPEISREEFIDHVQKKWRNRLQSKCSNGSSLEASCQQVKTCIQIALNCMQGDSQERPDMGKIVDQLDETETDIVKLSHKGGYKGVPHNNRMESKDTKNSYQGYLDVGEELIVGRTDEKNKIMTLLEESMKNKIAILPIYGIGGIGKTTFARMVSTDEKFKSYSHVWVHVSQIFNLDKIRNSITSQLSGDESRALIVLDDLWEKCPFELQKLSDLLYCGHRNTVVLVTTRSEDVAMKICTNFIEPYKIELLTDDMCWDIIKQRSGFEATDDKTLVDIGMEIARKCRGVALAAQSLGFSLKTLASNEWKKVRDSDIWNKYYSQDPSMPNYVLPSLNLSYEYMVPSLRPCFTYCGIFPKGHNVVKDDLVHQWISLGLIEETNMLSVMQAAENNIVQLVGLSFLQPVLSPLSYRAYGEHETLFTMHDLVHDLAISVLGDEILDPSKQGNTTGKGCLYALLSSCSKALELYKTLPTSLKALHFRDCRDPPKLRGAAFAPAASLRVLDLSGCSVKKLPDCIGELEHLRYLNVPGIQNRRLPKCITKLSKLMYLNLPGSSNLRALPNSIGEMECLRHIDLSGSRIRKMPESFGNLKYLKHLDLSDCNRVTGVLLSGLTKLEYLNLSNCCYVNEDLQLGNLTELQYLNLSNCYCLWNVDKVVPFGSFTKLKYLNLSAQGLDDFIEVSLSEALGRLTELRYLNLSYLKLDGLPRSFGSLCSLTHLDLSSCDEITGATKALRGLTKLQYLDLSYCYMDDTSSEYGGEISFENFSELRHLYLRSCIRSIHHDNQEDERDSFLQRIFSLTNLEHLDLSHNCYLYRIPETLSKLTKLHTLDLRCCYDLQRLPTSISEMSSLKILETMDCRKLDLSTLPQYKSARMKLPYFVVHANEGESSSNLIQLEDENPTVLQIHRLENVKSAEEAQRIKLLEKKRLKHLELIWTTHVDDTDILRELVPPDSVERLKLQGYNSTDFPSWVMRVVTYLPHLVGIVLWDIPNCSNLPPLGQLRNLEYLEIGKMDSIRKIDSQELYGGARPFPQLRKFSLLQMECLEVWNTDYIIPDVDGLNGVPDAWKHHMELSISHCPKLRFNGCLPQGFNIFSIHSSDEVVLSSCENTGYVDASIWICLKVECCLVPLHQWCLLRSIPCLKDLYIKKCSDLTCSSPSDLLQGLSSLKSLDVTDCESIISLPERLVCITSLQYIIITRCKGITALPDDIEQLAYLKEFRIYDCPELLQWCKSEQNKTKFASIRVHRDRFFPEIISATIYPNMSRWRAINQVRVVINFHRTLTQSRSRRAKIQRKYHRIHGL